ncbi:MAG: AAA family ATPase, partial [Clostridia bacterium]|nr:AAA family ATPase [Clostridia bacterium]
MSKSITWERLALRGFGRYGQGVEVTFNDGLNHIVAANEQGKSSLIAGLVATLFGLPGSSDAAKFGKARYRNWHATDRF